MLGLVFSASGAYLRLSAKDLVWPKNYSYSGPREATEWAIKERAYEDLGLALLAFGLTVLLLALAHWLWSRPTAVEGKFPAQAY